MIKKSYPITKLAIINKIKAALWHFLCSVLVFLMALAWIRWVLYPDFHFELNGVLYGLRLIASVDLVLGPLITLLVYHHVKPKREKIGDFAMVGVVQIAALAYGLQTMYMEHPRMISFNNYGTAVTVTQREFGEPDSGLPENLSEFGKVAGVPIAAIHPTNPEKRFSQIQINDLEKADKETRRTMNYDDDKQALAELEKQHGKVYVFGLMGKYQGMFVAMDAQQNLVGTFGQRDLH